MIPIDPTEQLRSLLASSAARAGITRVDVLAWGRMSPAQRHALGYDSLQEIVCFAGWTLASQPQDDATAIARDATIRHLVDRWPTHLLEKERAQ